MFISLYMLPYKIDRTWDCFLSIWLVAKCLGLNAVDIEGWSFILIKSFPFAALL